MSFLTVLGGFSEQTGQFARVPKADAELIDDTFRIVALMAAGADGVQSIADWSRNAGRSGEAGGFRDLLYDRLADLYATRGQYQKSVAVHQAFIADNRAHPSVPAFYAQSVDVWRMAGQTGRAREARADYVSAFSDSAQYDALASADQRRWLSFSKTLGDYYYDQGENASGGRRAAYFASAAGYYTRLASRQEQPGETLRLAGDAWLQAGRYEEALASFRKAAYEAPGYANANDAGWAALLLERNALDGTNSLKTTLARFADASEKWSASFKEDARIPPLSSDVANRLLARGSYDRARQFAQTAIAHPGTSSTVTYSALLVLGETYVAGDTFGFAENAWRQALELASSGKVVDASGDDVRRLRRQLATSIYRQGEQAAGVGKTDIAVAHFQRIDSVLPGSDIAVTGRFDAANTLLQAERWLPAVNELSRFRQDFPSHPLTDSIREKLVFAYISSDQPIRAADELVASTGASGPAMEDQLRAAELYHQAGAIQKRDRIYLAYLDQMPALRKPEEAQTHLLDQTFRQRLIDSDVAAPRFREQLVTAELASDWHSKDTLGWAGQAALKLAEIQANRFAAVELRAPLAESLSRKQQLLEAARSRYDQARQFGGDGVISQATFKKAELYRQFAADLMASEAPAELNEMEAMQYQMLLEEEAYPFEEKAISMHERNHQRLAEGVFDEWVEQSLQVLAKLFPGRYSRTVRWMSLSGESNKESKDGA